MSYTASTMRMICSNKDCINKSVVFRKYGSDNLICKACGKSLIKTTDQKTKHQNAVAKQQLKEFGLI